MSAAIFHTMKVAFKWTIPAFIYCKTQDKPNWTSYFTHPSTLLTVPRASPAWKTQTQTQKKRKHDFCCVLMFFFYFFLFITTKGCERAML